jgi:hypothetical protein
MSGKKGPFVAHSLSNTPCKNPNPERSLLMKNKLAIFAGLCCSVVIFALTASAQTQRCTEEGSIRSVTKGRSGRVETVTFELVGRGLPSKVEVRDEKPPIEDYGGENLHMKGRVFKSVFFGIVPWMCDIRESFKAKTTTIRDIKQTEQFEGYVSYAIGYTAKNKYAGKSVVYGRRSTKVIVKFRR